MTERLMKRDEIKIKFSGAYDAKCDNCGKRCQYLHQVKTPYWTKYFCDKCGSWFVTKEMKENENKEIETQGNFTVGDDHDD